MKSPAPIVVAAWLIVRNGEEIEPLLLSDPVGATYITTPKFLIINRNIFD